MYPRGIERAIGIVLYGGPISMHEVNKPVIYEKYVVGLKFQVELFFMRTVNDRIISEFTKFVDNLFKFLVRF